MAGNRIEHAMTQDLKVGARARLTAIASFVGGILISALGIGVMILALTAYLGEGTNLTAEESIGSLLVAVGGFLLAAVGPDIRIKAQKRLKALSRPLGAGGTSQ